MWVHSSRDVSALDEMIEQCCRISAEASLVVVTIIPEGELTDLSRIIRIARGFLSKECRHNAKQFRTIVPIDYIVN